MPRHNPVAIVSKAVFLAIVLVSFFSSFPPKYMKNLPLFPPLARAMSANPINAYEERFAKVKILMKEELFLGYTDENFSAIDYKDGRRFEPYYMAQYALVPLILENAKPHHRVVGNFKENFSFQEIADENGLRVLKDFSNGVVLFEKHVNR